MSEFHPPLINAGFPPKNHKFIYFAERRADRVLEWLALNYIYIYIYFTLKNKSSHSGLAPRNTPQFYDARTRVLGFIPPHTLPRKQCVHTCTEKWSDVHHALLFRGARREAYMCTMLCCAVPRTVAIQRPAAKSRAVAHRSRFCRMLKLSV